MARSTASTGWPPNFKSGVLQARVFTSLRRPRSSAAAVTEKYVVRITSHSIDLEQRHQRSARVTAMMVRFTTPCGLQRLINYGTADERNAAGLGRFVDGIDCSALMLHVFDDIAQRDEIELAEV